VSHVGRPTSPARMTLPFLGNPRISWSGGECLGNVSLKSNLAVPLRSGKRLLLCRFSDAGDDRAGHRLEDRRLKSAEARNRGKWGTVGAAGSMGIWPRR
jgi:hypothetical protein